MNLKRFIGKCKKAYDLITLRAKISYAQMGEDLIVEYLFESLKIKQPTYLEIGTNLPKVCNNTYSFYQKGYKGVCIEPDVLMYNEIIKARPKDTVLNIGIGVTSTKEATFYLFPNQWNGWSTFSKQEADLRKNQTGVTYEEKKVVLVNINEVMDKYFAKTPNFISLDVEGLDLEILQSINFTKHRPDVICVETITFGYLDNSEVKIDEISAFMHSNNYITYADTHINTIFCRKELFKKTNG